MDSRDAYGHRERYQFVDVRQTHEFEAGHVEGALHMTLQEVPTRYEELDRRRPVVVTCQVGQRSALAAEWLRLASSIDTARSTAAVAFRA